MEIWVIASLGLLWIKIMNILVQAFVDIFKSLFACVELSHIVSLSAS